MSPPYDASFTPPHCPSSACAFHVESAGWRFIKKGTFTRKHCQPRRVQRYQCHACGVHFSRQSFRNDYWLKRPELLRPIAARLVGCSGYRQIARDVEAAHSTVARQAQRLGRRALLELEARRPRGVPPEPLVLDGFESFELSQYFPFHLNLVVGAHTHYLYAFTCTELRRKGRMTHQQRRRREQLERQHGLPDPKGLEKDVATVLELVVPPGARVTLRSDEHPAYVRALKRLPDRHFRHERTSSKDARTHHNPLFPVNRWDLLLRHHGANHKRETIAFSKRRWGAVLRACLLAFYQTFMQPFSQNRQDATPAQRRGACNRRLHWNDWLERRRFPARLDLPEPYRDYYRGDVLTRRIPHGTRHELKYAF